MSKFTLFVAVAALVSCVSTQDGAGGTKNLIDVNTDTVFNYAVLNNRKPVVVFFGNGQCGTCKWVYPQLERLAKNRNDKLYLAKVDMDTLPDLAADYGVTSAPTIMTLFYGEIIEMVEGPQWAKIVGLVNNASKLEM